MSPNANTRLCSHVKVNGIPCGSPALRREHFCYFHQRMLRGVRTPTKPRLHHIALIENEEAIQASLMEIINALVRNTIDFERAKLILRALYIAVRNAPSVRFHSLKSEMVHEVPEFPPAGAEAGGLEPMLPKAAALARVKTTKSIRIDQPQAAVLAASTPAAATVDRGQPKPPASFVPPPARKSVQSRAR